MNQEIQELFDRLSDFFGREPETPVARRLYAQRVMEALDSRNDDWLDVYAYRRAIREFVPESHQ